MNKKTIHKVYFNTLFVLVLPREVPICLSEYSELALIDQDVTIPLNSQSRFE